MKKTKTPKHWTAKEWAEHMIYFEMGVLLLDANIKYLLHTHMYEGDD